MTTDRDVRGWRDHFLGTVNPHPELGAMLAELLAYRKAARKLRKAYGMAGPARSGSLILGVCDVLAVGAKR